VFSSLDELPSRNQFSDGTAHHVPPTTAVPSRKRDPSSPLKVRPRSTADLDSQAVSPSKPKRAAVAPVVAMEALVEDSAPPVIEDELVLDDEDTVEPKQELFVSFQNC